MRVAVWIGWNAMAVAACARGEATPDDISSSDDSGSQPPIGSPRDAAPSDVRPLPGDSAGPGGNADASASDSSRDDAGSSSGADGSSSADSGTSAGSDSGADGESGSGDSSGSAMGADAGPDAPACANDLSNVQTADFHIGFTLATTQSGLVALLDQRSACDHSALWDVRLSSGAVTVEIADGADAGAPLNLATSGVTVNDGLTHKVLVTRVGGTLTIRVDGAAYGSASAPQSLGQLPPLRIGSDACDGHGGQVPFVGTLTDVCASDP